MHMSRWRSVGCRASMGTERVGHWHDCAGNPWQNWQQSRFKRIVCELRRGLGLCFALDIPAEKRLTQDLVMGRPSNWTDAAVQPAVQCQFTYASVMKAERSCGHDERTQWTNRHCASGHAHIVHHGTSKLGPRRTGCSRHQIDPEAAEVSLTSRSRAKYRIAAVGPADCS
jgi:hypothetical protein